MKLGLKNKSLEFTILILINKFFLFDSSGKLIKSAEFPQDEFARFDFIKDLFKELENRGTVIRVFFIEPTVIYKIFPLEKEDVVSFEFVINKLNKFFSYSFDNDYKVTYIELNNMLYVFALPEIYFNLCKDFSMKNCVFLPVSPMQLTSEKSLKNIFVKIDKFEKNKFFGFFAEYDDFGYLKNFIFSTYFQGEEKPGIDGNLSIEKVQNFLFQKTLDFDFFEYFEKEVENVKKIKKIDEILKVILLLAGSLIILLIFSYPIHFFLSSKVDEIYRNNLFKKKLVFLNKENQFIEKKIESLLSNSAIKKINDILQQKTSLMNFEKVEFYKEKKKEILKCEGFCSKKSDFTVFVKRIKNLNLILKKAELKKTGKGYYFVVEINL